MAAPPLNSSVRPLKAMHAPLTEIRRIGGDPADDVWQWFVTRGPHGSEFTWGQTRSSPPGYVGLTHLEEIVAARRRPALVSQPEHVP